MSDTRGSVDIAVQPWFRDHGFDGRTVLPAVEIMLLLAREAIKCRPDLDVRVMEQALFSRFFELPPDAFSCPALVECLCTLEGSVNTRLQSRVRFKLTSRIVDHAAMTFPGIFLESSNAPEIQDNAPSTVKRKISARTVYREYVPFGPAYRSLQGTLKLTQQGASGLVRAPEFPLVPEAAKAGSPFPLDGALHAACVHGQGQVDFVPFPVGFARRIIYQPTRPGREYHVRVEQTGAGDGELVYDLLIFDGQGRVFERVEGLQMRNVGVTRPG